jgi:hypothetical protein
MALRFLEAHLRRELARLGHDGLMDAAVGSIGLTDDGSTIYVHLFPHPGWPHRAQGQAFVLAWQDYAEDRSQRLDCYRWLIGEARLSLLDNVNDIVRWLERR